MIVDGWPIFSFTKKLKGLKVILKDWNNEIFDNIYSQKQMLLDKINSLDSLEESGCFKKVSWKEKFVKWLCLI